MTVLLLFWFLFIVPFFSVVRWTDLFHLSLSLHSFHIRTNIEAHLLHFCLFWNLLVFSFGLVSSIEIQPINFFHTTLFDLPSSFQVVLISMIYKFNTKMTILLKCFSCVCARAPFFPSLKRYVSWNHIKLFRPVLYLFTFRLKNKS